MSEFFKITFPEGNWHTMDTAPHQEMTCCDLRALVFTPMDTTFDHQAAWYK